MVFHECLSIVHFTLTHAVERGCNTQKNPQVFVVLAGIYVHNIRCGSQYPVEAGAIVTAISQLIMENAIISHAFLSSLSKKCFHVFTLRSGCFYEVLPLRKRRRPIRIQKTGVSIQSGREDYQQDKFRFRFDFFYSLSICTGYCPLVWSLLSLSSAMVRRRPF